MGAVHLEAMEASATTVCCGVVDPVAAVRAELEARGLNAYASIEEALTEDQPMAALVAAPSDLHLGLVEKLTDLGLDLLVPLETLSPDPHLTKNRPGQDSEAG